MLILIKLYAIKNITDSVLIYSLYIMIALKEFQVGSSQLKIFIWSGPIKIGLD